MELADYAMIANSVKDKYANITPQDTIQQQQTIGSIAANRKAQELKNTDTGNKMAQDKAMSDAISRNTKYDPTTKSIKTDRYAVANDLLDAGHGDLAEAFDTAENIKQLELLRQKNDHNSRVLQAAIDAPDPQSQQHIWDIGRQQLASEGHDVTKIPEVYDDGFARQIQAQTLSGKEQIEIAMKGLKGGANNPDYILVTDEDGNQFKMNKHSNEDAQPVIVGGKQIRSPVYSQQSQYGLTATRENAKADVERATKPQIEGLIVKEKAKAENDAARGKQAQKSGVVQAMFDQAIGEVESSFNDTTTMPGAAAVPFTASAQRANGAISAIGPVMKNIFRESGEGSWTDGDQKALDRMSPSLNDWPETRKAKIENIKKLVKIKMSNGNVPLEDIVNQYGGGNSQPANTEKTQSAHPDDIQALINAARSAK